MYVEEYERWLECGGSASSDKSSKDNEENSSDTSISDDDDDDDDTDESEHIEKTDKTHLSIPFLTPNIKFSLSSTDPSFPLQSKAYDASSPTSPTNETKCDIPPVPAIDIELHPALLPNRGRRRSISRQEAIFIEPTGSSLENLDSVKSPIDSESKKLFSKRNNEKHSTSGDSSDNNVQDYFLTVPETDLRRDRAASVDSSFSKLSSNGKTEELQPEIDGFLAVPTNAVRSRSVDIVLPTNEQARYKALSLAGPSMSKRYVNLSYKLTKRTKIQFSFYVKARLSFGLNAIKASIFLYLFIFISHFRHRLCISIMKSIVTAHFSVIKLSIHALDL